MLKPSMRWHQSSGVSKLAVAASKRLQARGYSKQDVAASKRLQQVSGNSKHAFATMNQWQHESGGSMQTVVVSNSSNKEVVAARKRLLQASGGCRQAGAANKRYK